MSMRSTGPDAIQNTQEALAKAWSSQFKVSCPQLQAMAYILQVACSIRQGKPDDMKDRLADMQKMMDDNLHNSAWDSMRDAIAIPVNRTPKSSHVSPDTQMILGIGDDGRDILMMDFMSKADAYAISYLLCGMVLLHRNSLDQKAFKMLEAGLGNLSRDIQNAKKVSSSALPGILSHNRWRGEIICYFRLYLAFCVATIGNWTATRRYLDQLKATADDFEVSFEGPLGCLLLYLTGVYHQGVGDFEVALGIYRNPKFDLTAKRGTHLSSSDQLEHEIALMAALNTLSILQVPQHMDVNVNNAILNQLEPLCMSHSNRDIQTGFNVIKSIVKTGDETRLVEVKSHLRAALEGGRKTANTQFTCIALSVMCSRFFTGMIGPQAEKSAAAAAEQAKRNGNPIWRSVAEGMLSQTCDVNGKPQEAEESRRQAKLFSKQAGL